MSIVYTCRHCSQEIGKLEEKFIDSSVLGLQQLTKEEKEDMIHYAENGDMLIQAICESCEESLSQHPHYHELDYFIQ
ncbi:anti-sigma-F factor Fin family protein [Virgibacillus sp. YIM 98842]|uniref:anti-sigma-F factor Fin family protein n=1 Tax=Virgibacillus sp. YIM 98842 TaxID=2663533 RepID=UPI0013D8F122|nr:anti-sigma-F factor Fin family protein [Virgibacillus sp. YIM 98842]